MPLEVEVRLYFLALRREYQMRSYSTEGDDLLCKLRHPFGATPRTQAELYQFQRLFSGR